MHKVGLIGYGKWGKILYNKLKNICDLKFICTSKDDYESKLKDVEWVVIATPNDTHYNIVRNCILNKKNIFCEKPLTPTTKQSKMLFDYAEMMGVKLYVNDIQNYRNYNFPFNKNNLVERRKNGGGNIKEVLYRLTYHDIYTLYDYIKDFQIKSIHPINLDNKLQFKVNFNDFQIEFIYDINHNKKEHFINGVNLQGNDDILTKMLQLVLDEKVDFQHNKKITLYTNNLIEKISKKLFPKIAVVGGGVFGCTSAWMLSKQGYDVDLFEKNNDIMTQASYINQYRLHRGYHYPRSKETAQSSIEGERSFLKVYGDSVINGKTKHYYCIAKNDSLISKSQYIKFLEQLNLPYKKKKLGIINKNVVNLTIEANEMLFDPYKLKSLVWKKLKQFSVNVNLNTKFDKKNYDYVINATYSNLNEVIPEKKQKNYQFELCEKPVLKLPISYKNKSVVIMDGPFMCIDPLGDTDYHVMGNVVHAIHSRNIGKYPVFEEKFNELLNKGIIKNPKITNINKFINSAKKFFKDIEKSKHIGSMYTIRTVLPNKEQDDARPTLVENIYGNIFNLFSGKIGTCVNAGNEIKKLIKGKL